MNGKLGVRHLSCVALAALALALAGCGDDGGGGGAASSDQGATEGAKKAPTLEASKGAKGKVTMCAGKDTSGALTEAIKLFNKQHAADGLKVEILELAADATAVRDQFIQRAQAKSADCDVLQADIIWIAEFAQQQWLMDLSDYAKPRTGEFIDSTISSLRLRRQALGAPAGHRRRPALPPHRPGARRAGDMAGALRAGREGTTASPTRARRTRA